MFRLILYIGILSVAACTCPRENQRLQTGDLLFQCGTGAMTEAIAEATGRGETLKFTHVGIAIIGNRADSILEATSDGGVRMTSLNDFLNKSAKPNGRPAVVAKRLKDTTGIAAAVRKARTRIGAPYDYSFLPDNGRYYCSELVYESYRRPDGTPYFTARPMNFRAPDGTLPRYWSELFERLGEPLPEGVPGTNPNDMAQEETLYEVHRWF